MAGTWKRGGNQVAKKTNNFGELDRLDNGQQSPSAKRTKSDKKQKIHLGHWAKAKGRPGKVSQNQ